MLKRIFIFPIKIYQILISPVIGGNRCCRFAPTCSSYAIESIEKLGIFKGLMFALWRILRCNPWGGSGYDPVIKEKTVKVKKILAIFLISVLFQPIPNPTKSAYAQPKISPNKDDDIIFQLKKETEAEEMALKPDLESLGLDQVDTVAKSFDIKKGQNSDDFLTNSPDVKKIANEANKKTNKKESGSSKKPTKEAAETQQKQPETKDLAIKNEIPNTAPVQAANSETPKEQNQKEKGFFEKKISDITAEPIKKIKELIESKTEEKADNTQGHETQNTSKTEAIKTESNDKKITDAKKKLDDKKKKSEERRKRQIAIAELAQKQKTKKIEELRQKYLQKNDDEVYERTSHYQSMRQIIPQPKTYPQFVNAEVPPPLVNRFRGEENRHHPVIMSNSEKIDFMFKAIAENKIDEFNSLFALVKDPNIKNSSGDTLLTFAILMRKYDAISSLLSKGANPDLVNDLGYTPLNIAIEMVDYQSTSLLVNMGAKVNLVDDLGRTYLMQSSRVGSLPITDLLVSKGVDVNIADKNGTTALAIAYRHKKDIIVKYLLKFGAKSWIKKNYTVDDTSMVEDLFNKWK